ncbi:MAG: hypothetical protein ACREA0_08745, partial [bacterium]
MDWSRRLDVIRDMQRARAIEVARIEAEDRQGPPDLYDTFQRRLGQNLRRFPLLRRRMDCSMLFVVEGEPGGLW